MPRSALRRRFVPGDPISLEDRRLLSTLVVRDVVYRREGDRPERLDYYLPTSRSREAASPVLIAIHGGGWRRFDKAEYGRSLARFTKAGFAVVSVNYSLATPERPSYPENIEDVRESIRWVKRNSARLGFDATRITLIGESAGGHLAALAGLDPAESSESPDGISTRVGAVVAFYPPTDLARLVATSPAAVPAVFGYLGGPPASVLDRYRDASPVTHASIDDPPILLIHGESDSLVPAEQSEILAQAVQSVGGRARVIVATGEGHGFRLQIGRKSLFPNILAFLRATWNDTGITFRANRLSVRHAIE